jgi:Protein of unknown function (DUF3047)
MVGRCPAMAGSIDAWIWVPRVMPRSIDVGAPGGRPAIAGATCFGHHGAMRRRPHGFRGLFLVLVGVLVLIPSSPGAQSTCIVLEDFARSPVNAFPAGWRVVKGEGEPVYSVRAENGTRFLRASSKGLGIQAAKEREWNLAEYPVLRWKWRPRIFPEGANEQAGKNDSALAVYAVFPHSAGSLKSVKYIWSELVPAGTHLTSSMGLTQVRVLRSGADGKGRWTDERANVLEDYKKYFGADAPRPAGIAVLTDGDDTKSQAQGDYARFRACAQ